MDRHGRLAAEGLSDRTVARIVQGTAEKAALDPKGFAGHSLRAGFATTAAKKGKSLDAIMRQTLDKSEEVARGYIRAREAVRRRRRGWPGLKRLLVAAAILLAMYAVLALATDHRDGRDRPLDRLSRLPFRGVPSPDGDAWQGDVAR